jgi:hypothetical protein
VTGEPLLDEFENDAFGIGDESVDNVTVET